MTLTVTKTEEREVEITFPAYKEHGSDLYKIIDEDLWIEVEWDASLFGYCGVRVHSKRPPFYANVLTDGRDITEDQFNEKFLQVFNTIKNYKP